MKNGKIQSFTDLNVWKEGHNPTRIYPENKIIHKSLIVNHKSFELRCDFLT